MAGWNKEVTDSGGDWTAGIAAPPSDGFDTNGFEGPSGKSGFHFRGDDDGYPAENGGGGAGGGACRICNEEGHFARECPSKPQETYCRYCKKEDHLIADCPVKPPMEDGCRICKQEGHMARDCPDKPDNFGACFNCGEQGHNKAECTAPKVFMGTCRICEKEGHSAKECPDRPPDVCLNCKEEGHLAATCTRNRVITMPHVALRSCEDAWNDMRTASEEDDFDGFKEHLLEYLKAMHNEGTPIDLSDLEISFRDNGYRYYILALKTEVTHDKVIVGPNGELDREYTWALYRSYRPRRTKALTGRVAETPADNLQWLKHAGILCDELRPFCLTCKEKGHTSRACDIEKEDNEPVMIKCVNCQALGHRMRDCPLPRKKLNGCRNCGEEGHRASECEKPRMADEFTECRKCNQMGHFSRDCPTGGPPQLCFNCGEEGHRSSECTNERVMKCRNCDEFGHSAKECPKPRDMARVKCNNCGEMGHYSRGCTNDSATPAGVLGDESNDYNNGSASAWGSNGEGGQQTPISSWNSGEDTSAAGGDVWGTGGGW